MPLASTLLSLLSMCGARAASMDDSGPLSFGFASVFGDDVVLQRDAITAVYGWGTPGMSVTVTVTKEEAGVTELAVPSARVATNGHWKAMLPAHAAGTGFTLTAKGTLASDTATLQLEHVAFGDVWFCSGQSNMELGLYYTFTRNESLAAVSSGKYDNIRIMHFDHNPVESPLFVTNGSIATNYPDNSSWLAPAAAMKMKKNDCHGDNCPSELDGFSAACWYFGESLTDRMVADLEDGGRDTEPVPIGLIQSAFGGTCIESWLSQDAQLGCSNITCTSNQSWPYTKDTQAACAAVKSAGSSAGSNAELYNGMVLPFVNMTVKGWLWCACVAFYHFVYLTVHCVLCSSSIPRGN